MLKPRADPDVADAVLAVAEEAHDPSPVRLGDGLQGCEVVRIDRSTGDVWEETVHASYTKRRLTNVRLTEALNLEGRTAQGNG